MTEKQEEILKAALELFSKDGFASTSTSKIATQAGVSEGLIFRHFKNKEGLLKAIAQMGEEKFRLLYSNILEETNPVEIIRNTILMPTLIQQQDYDFWRLQFKLKWEVEGYNKDKGQDLKKILIKAFKALDYEDAEMEANLLLFYLNGIGTSILKGEITDINSITTFLIKKYHLA